jgi:hypothetical protein
LPDNGNGKGKSRYNDNSNGNGKSRFPSGMTNKKQATAKATAKADSLRE